MQKCVKKPSSPLSPNHLTAPLGDDPPSLSDLDCCTDTIGLPYLFNNTFNIPRTFPMLVQRRRTPLFFSKVQSISLITLQWMDFEVCEHFYRKDSKKWHCSCNRHVRLMFPNVLLNCHIYLHLHQHLWECTSSELNIHVLNVSNLIHIQTPARMPPPRIPGFPPPSCFISFTIFVSTPNHLLYLIFVDHLPRLTRKLHRMGVLSHLLGHPRFWSRTHTERKLRVNDG